MNTRRTSPRLLPTAGQSGQAAIIALLLILGVGVTILVYNFPTPAKLSIESDRKTTAALAQAKEALIGRATGDASRLGSLPCPDIDNDGALTMGVDYLGGGACASNIGRLPWRTLGLPDLRDGSGERLWYALSSNFQDASGIVINSDTLGQITITGIAPANNVIAIVFAPGPFVASQVRDAANQNNVVNYLEGENANGDTTYTTAPASSTFNDKLLAITGPALMPIVERRVAREMMALLEQYRTATGVYPWADLADGNSNGVENNNAYNKNRFPCGTAQPTAWGSGGTPSLPSWLTNGCASLTGWAAVIYYAVAKNRLQNGGVGCAPTSTNCTASTLTVTNSSSRPAELCQTGVTPFLCSPTVVSTGPADLILITPGAYTGSPTRTWPTSFTTIFGYFEDSENSDNNNDSYDVPTSTSSNRDRIYIVR